MSTMTGDSPLAAEGPVADLAEARDSPVMETVVRLHEPGGPLGRVIALCEAGGRVPMGPGGLTVDQVLELLSFQGAMTILASHR
jgi:hypothetical protein